MGDIPLSLLPKRHDGVEVADRSCIKSCNYKICSVRKIQIDDLKAELNSPIDIEGKVIHPKYYKDTNKYCIFSFFGVDWAVRSALRISTIFLK